MKGKRLKLAAIGLTAFALTLPVFAAGSLHVTGIAEKSAVPGLEYSCAYPRVSGMIDASKQQRLNVRFREMAVSARKAAELEAKKRPGSALKGSYGFAVTRNRAGIMSLKLSEALAGAGNPRAASYGVTVNTVSGETYQLGDLFFDNADYVGMISENVGKQISLRGLDRKLLHPFRGIRRSENYYLTDEDLVIVLGQEDFPRGMAVQEFPIKLSSLEGSLKPSLRLST